MQQEEINRFQNLAAQLDPSFQEKMEKQRSEEMAAKLMNFQINQPQPSIEFNFQNLLLPPNETNQQINQLTGSKINIRHERDDFAYICPNDIKGYQKFQQLFEQYEKSGQQFKDQDFPSDLNSLIEKEDSHHQYGWKQYVWKRPNEFYKGEFYLFIKSLNTFQYNDPQNIKLSRINNLQVTLTGLDGIQPDDVKQGELGDCYFLATLSAIAEFPWRIKQLFVTRKVNRSGIYCVKLCHFGEWQTVIIDDSFPCNYEGPAFTRGNDNEIWVLILEKAWAKLFGCYERIEAGAAREALRSLTGAPTAVIWTDCPEEELWEEIQSGDRQNFIMTCGSQDDDELTKTQADKMGLVPGHAYTLIGCAEYKGAKLVLLRNPWGTKEWKGKWSDFEDIWTPQLKQQLNHNPDSNDGTFFIELCDFRKYFTDMQICYFRDGYQYSSFKTQSNSRNATLIQMKVTEASDYYISINQESKRMFNDNQNFEYSVCKILIARVNPNGSYEWVGGKQDKDREFWVNVKLTPGNYLIYVKTYWYYLQSKFFVLSSYGKGKVEFQQTTKSQHPQNIIELIMKTHPKGKLCTYDELSYINQNQEISAKEGFGMFWIQNKGTKPFSTKITLTNMGGLKLRKPFKGNVIQLSVQPQQEAIAVVNASYKGYSLGCREQYAH